MEVDVLVVGYGPVGAALAALLGQYGVRTLVVDKAPAIFSAPRAIALDNEALRILQMVGLGDDAFARKPIPFVALRSKDSGEFARINMARTVDCHPVLVTFFQPELEAALRAQAERQPSVTARVGVELVRFEEVRGGVRAVLRAADGSEEVVDARYLVGADGASSSIRTAIGESFEGETYAEDWLIVDALDVPDTIDHVEFLCDPERPGPHMVAPGNRTRWEFMLKPGESREAMLKDDAIATLLAPWSQGAPLRIERSAVYRFHARVCAHFSKGRVFLVGDAAHITPPFAGQGLVAGLRDVANLSWKLAWVLGGRAEASILSSYDEERRPHAEKMINLARFAGFVIMPRSTPRARSTHGIIKALRRLPPFRHLIDDFHLKPTNSYPHGLFVRGRRRHGLQRGAWLPQGRVRGADGAIRRSDDVLGAGMALVCSRAAAAALTPEVRQRFAAHGGAVVVVVPAGAAPAPGEVEDVDGAFAAFAEAPWCAAVRPDRTVLHDGAVAADVLDEALALLGEPLAAAA